MAELERVVLELDELEALRLADLEGKYHEAAAEAMGVSRPTFGRIIESARRKVADALLNGKALAIRTCSAVIRPCGPAPHCRRMTACFAALAQSKVLVACDVQAADLHLLLRPEIMSASASGHA